MTSSKLDQCIDFLNELNAKDVQFFERDLLDHLAQKELCQCTQKLDRSYFGATSDLQLRKI